MANYILTPDDEEVSLPKLNKINNRKIYLQDEARTQAGTKVVQTFGGNKKSIVLGFAPTAASIVRGVENLLDSCPGYSFTIYLDYLQGSIFGKAKFSSEKVLAGTDLYTCEIEIEEE